MFNWVQSAWHWTVEPLPLLLALAIYFGPVIYMRWKKIVYTPLYFLVPFLRVQVADVDKYLGGNFLVPFIENEDKAEELKRKVSLTANLSALLQVILIPALTAFFWSLFLNTPQFITALVVLIAIRAYQFFTSVLTFHHRTINTPRFKGWLTTFYAVVLGTMLVTMLITRNSVLPFLATGNYVQLFWNLAQWIFWNVLIGSIVVVSLTTKINSVLFDEKVRQKNLNKHYSSNGSSNKTVT